MTEENNAAQVREDERVDVAAEIRALTIAILETHLRLTRKAPPVTMSQHK